jgi:hypothetical protein
VRKIISEILVLLWKAFKVVVWNWLRPMVGRMFLFLLLAIGLVIFLVSVMR